MAKRGAKGKYEQYVKPKLEEIKAKIRQGVTEEQIAKALGISVASLNNYRNQYPEFKEALSKDKGKDVLTALINAGIESAIGGVKDSVEITEEEDEKGNITKKTITKHIYIPPNPALNKFYVMNYGKAQGFTNDPLNYELAKQKQAHTEKIDNAKNWDLNLDNYK